MLVARLRLPRLGPLAVLAPPLCWGCGAPAPVGPLCGACLRLIHRLPPEPVPIGDRLQAWAAVSYQGPAKELVRALKYRGARKVADTMAAQIAACAPAELVAPRPGAVLVPVPLHPARRRARSFNQAELLANALGERLGLPVAGCLARTHATPPQVGRTRADRLEALVGAFRPTATPSHPILVDDVITTGATLAACAAALAASETLSALTYAHAPGR